MVGRRDAAVVACVLDAYVESYLAGDLTSGQLELYRVAAAYADTGEPPKWAGRPGRARSSQPALTVCLLWQD